MSKGVLRAMLQQTEDKRTIGSLERCRSASSPTCCFCCQANGELFWGSHNQRLTHPAAMPRAGKANDSTHRE
ncbi:hypothetical protein BC832DRAFT_556999 [Gaertneriomyces semiglobifer]|nr:hypothetical protein BC832DRAFT_556999 [Gaertneriomyces semiglobifer]